MRTTALISEEEYLRTSYSPDCEFEDGAVIERNRGEQDHSWLQGLLTAYLIRRRKTWNIEVFPEMRHQIRPGRYRIPDICVTHGPRPAGKVFTKPPWSGSRSCRRKIGPCG